MAAETGDFAELVRGLKERSGLSYGALAKRLHVSTSTLHRYCNGDAVPTEFAPVERLGRLCGATRDELVELHRSWILADEARRRGKAAPAGTEPADFPEPTAAGPVAVEPAVVAPAAVEPAAVEPTVAAPTVVEAAAPRPVGDAPRGPSRTRVRLAVVATAAAVVAVAVPVGYSMVSASDSPPTSPKGAPAAAAPLSVGVSSYNWDAPCGQYYALDKEPGQVPPPPTPQDTRGWARALDGVDGGRMMLQLTAVGRTEAAVVINALHVRVVERADPLDRAAYAMGDGCGGIVTPQSFDIDLDAPRPYAKPVAGHDGDAPVPAKDFPYKVSTSDPQVLNLDVHTDAHVVGWYLELDWSSGERHGKVRIDDDGEPFRTSAIEGKKTYGYRPDTGTWAAQAQ
ncbi:helix-turn-helix domain-containing protein [Streptomyces sp. NPDC008121]|uniref:helix-turn-helix domain-containing protein n=1 Tax=Streptomyces sp. NPDC008121 TaxID=3364809 RepID=UPI0036EE74D8